MEFVLKAPLDVQIELSEGCNHNCEYCYNRFEHKKAGNYIDRGEIKKVINQLYKNQVFSVILTGGEPFLNKENLFYALELLKERKIDSYLNTNLSLQISKEEAEKLKDFNLVLVSFPSLNEAAFNEITGSRNYKKVIKNLDILAEHKINLGVNQVVEKKNIRDVYNTGKFLFEKFGIKKFSATPINPREIRHRDYEISNEGIIQISKDLIRLEKEFGLDVDLLDCIPACFFPQYMRQHKIAKHGCSAGKTTAVVGASGEVRRCTRLEKRYGNLFIEDFKNIWKRMTLEKKMRNEECHGCINSSNCYNGCENRAILNLGRDYLVKNRITKMKKEEIDDNKKYRTKQFKTRYEGNNTFLITDGYSIIFGNKNLLDFLEKIKDVEFDMPSIKEKLGDRGEGLISYLHDLGMLENVN